MDLKILALVFNFVLICWPKTNLINVYHVPGLCLIGIGGAPTSVIKLWLENHIFTFSTSSLKQPAGGNSYYSKGLLKPLES